MSGAGTQAENRYQRAFQGSYAALHHWRILLTLGVIVVTLLSAWEFVSGDTGWKKTRQIEAETARMISENATLGRQVQDMKAQERLLTSDDFVLEKIVRENLRLTRPGEILYFFDENPANSSSLDPVEVTVAKRPPKKPEDEQKKVR